MTDYENESRELLVDGQLIPVPSQNEWKAILETGMYLGIPATLQDDRRSMIKAMDFVKGHQDDFCLGFIYLTRKKNCRMMVVLCWMGGDWRRVHIETVNCDNCDWRGKTAHPLDSSLFFGASDEWAAIRRGRALSHQTCPKCGEERLPRCAIWTEKYPGEKDAA